MIRFFAVSSMVILFIFSITFVYGQGTLSDYQRAEQYIHFNVNKFVRNIEINPIWANDGFCYREELPTGHRFTYVSTKNGKQQPAFNHSILARSINDKFGKTFGVDSLPIAISDYHSEYVKFWFNKKQWKFNFKSKQLEVIEENHKLAQNESLSPDGKWKVSVENYNLWLTNMDTKTKVALTTDGVDRYDYATPVSWYKTVEIDAEDSYNPSIWIEWSPNSKKFVAHRMDRRMMKRLYLYQSVPDSGMRAKVWHYDRPLPGENTAKTLEYFIFDVDLLSQTPIAINPFVDFLSNINPTWFNDSQRIYMSQFSRGYKSIQAFIVDANSGKADTIVFEESPSMVEYQMMFSQLTPDNKHLVWSSERDGWNHLYLYNIESRKLVKQLTKGEFVVRSIAYIDNNNIWFTAGGREVNSDPYFRYLYKTDINGSEPILLTPEHADHDVRISPDGKYFVDNASRIDLPTVSNLRSMINGKLVAEVQRANIDKLLALGYRMPEPFKVKCRFGKEDIYGAIFYPSNFDPTKSYPVIDATYSGPQAVRTPKTFARGYRNGEQPLAEIGFIVVTVDGLGSALRSKKFHDFSYANLGDIGSDDHIAAIKQLAIQRSYMDTTRVGIYGHSAGGYDAARALLIRPKFYKVGVSSAGNHDFRMSKAWWDEQYMGLPGPHFIEQSNLTWANKLEGKLLIFAGDMDQNVNPANTLRLAAEFIKHNKDFDMFIYPNADHDLYSYPYIIRRRWDYFVQHLLGVTPPNNYEIKISTNK
jgi:dienelactone hydrolase